MRSLGRRPPKNRTSRLGLLAAAAGTVAWGSGGVLVRVANVASVPLAGYRLSLGAMLMFGVAVLTGHRPSSRVLVNAAAPGVMFAASVVLFFAALGRTTVADATVIAEALKPIAVIVLAAYLLDERHQRATHAWALAAVAGGVLVALGSAGGLGGHLVGDALAVGSLISGATVTVLSRRARLAVGSREFMSALLIVAALAITPLLILSGTTPADISLASWFWLLLLAAIPGGVGYLMMVFALGHLDAATCTVIASATPVVAALFAWLFLGEAIPLLVGFGGAIAMVGAAAVVRLATTSRERLANTATV